MAHLEPTGFGLLTESEFESFFQNFFDHELKIEHIFTHLVGSLGGAENDYKFLRIFRLLEMALEKCLPKMLSPNKVDTADDGMPNSLPKKHYCLLSKLLITIAVKYRTEQFLL